MGSEQFSENVEDPAPALEAQTGFILTCQAQDIEDSLYTCEFKTMSEDAGKKDPPVPEEIGVDTGTMEPDCLD
ncbi:hypothetical protein Y1Q_0001021 [Alligator mississippiensis]|uniref:Uncharacterized protein n=1 Tax=Alligator mississippiensis TaxID=8496 RepID=A0A151NEC5_ALLMI|nr:hypothetical protein Y1Q_0001021 [Alligator mississippiensis]